MERNIKERVSQYVDENKVKEKLTLVFSKKKLSIEKRCLYLLQVLQHLC